MDWICPISHQNVVQFGCTVSANGMKRRTKPTQLFQTERCDFCQCPVLGPVIHVCVNLRLTGDTRRICRYCVVKSQRTSRLHNQADDVFVASFCPQNSKTVTLTSILGLYILDEIRRIILKQSLFSSYNQDYLQCIILAESNYTKKITKFADLRIEVLNMDKTSLPHSQLILTVIGMYYYCL